MSRENYLVINSKGILDALYLNPALRRETNKVGKAVVDEAKSALQSVGSTEALQVASRVIYKSPLDGKGVRSAKTPVQLARRELNLKSVAGTQQYEVGVVASNHPTTLFWEFGTSKRKALRFMTTAMRSVAKGRGVRRVAFDPPRAPKGKKR
jgi:hypothetical protein